MHDVTQALKVSSRERDIRLSADDELFELLSAACSERFLECCSGNGNCPPKEEIRAV